MKVALAIAALLLGLVQAGAQGESKESCLQRWEQAERAKIIHSTQIDQSRGIVVRVVVDEDAWNGSTFDLKTRIAETLECVVSFKGLFIDFHSHRTNKVLGEWRVNNLTVK